MMPLPAALQPLTAADYWVGWRWATRANGKLTKPPVCPRGGPAESDNPRTWSSFTAAVEAVEAGRAAGVGYVCLFDRLHVFIDLDKCRDRDSGTVADWAMAIVEAANSYTEVTPSGTGLRIIGSHGHLTAPIARALKLGAGKHEVEVYYQTTRYVTVTGDRLPGTPDALADIADVALDLLVAGGRAAAEGEGQAFTPNAEQAAPIGDVVAALQAIGNPDLPYEEWVRLGLATYAATGGSAFGRLAWVDWSRKSAKHDDDECTRVWRSFGKARPTRIGFGTLYHIATTEDAFWQPPSWTAKRAQHSDGQKSKAGPGEEPGENSDPWAGTAAPQPAPFSVLDIDQIMAMAPPPWRIDGIMAVEGYTGLYGPPGSLKSFIALGMALSIAYGVPWCGRPVRQAAVLYVAGEGARGLGKRIAAWLRHHGLEDAPRGPFRLIAQGVNLTDPAQTAKLVLTTLGIAAATGKPVGATFVDTLARAMVGADENSATDMGQFNEQVARYIRDARPPGADGSTVVAIHHSGKNADLGARGSNSFLGAVDTMIKVKRDAEDGDRVAVLVEKQKDDEEGAEIRLAALRITVGDPLVADPVTSLVIVPDEAPDPAEAEQPKAKRPKPLSNGAQVGLIALQWAMERTGTERRGMRDVPGNTRTVTRMEWRKAYLDQSEAPTETAAKVAFGRAVSQLIAAGVVRTSREFAWLVRDSE